MAVTLTGTAGSGSLRWPGTPNLKPALSSGDGFWTGFWLRLPADADWNTQAKSITGYDGQGGEDGDFNDGNEAGFSIGPDNTKKPRWSLKTSTGLDLWSQAGLQGGTTDASVTSVMGYSEEWLVLWGVQEVSGSWRLWRAICKKNSSFVAGDSQVTDGTTAIAAINTFATSTHRLRDRVLQNVGTSTLTPIGTGVEHVVATQGLFPFTAGAPTTAIIEGLAAGTYQWSSAAVLNGGTILDWRKLIDETNLKNYGSTAGTVGDLTMSGTVVGATIIADTWVSLSAAGVLDGYTFDALHPTPTMTLSGVRAPGVSIEYEIFLKTAATVIQSWKSTGVTYPTATTWSIAVTGLALRSDGDEYRGRVRDAADTSNVVTVSGNFSPGLVIPFNEQSTFQHLSQPGVNGQVSSVSANNLRVMYPLSKDAASGVAIVRVASNASYGSAYAEMANACAALLGATHYPIMIVDITYSGETIDLWVADDNPGGLPLMSGYAAMMLTACQGRVSAFLRGAVLGTNVAANLDTLFGNGTSMFGALLTNQPATPPVYLLPSERQNADDSWARRQVLVDKIATGGRWKMAFWLVDSQKDGDSSRHQAGGGPAGDTTAAAHIAGNRRHGWRFGLFLASLLRELFGGTAIDRLGPQALSAMFTADLTAFDVTWSQDIGTPSTHTTGLGQHWWTVDNWTGKTEGVAAITGARTTRVAKSGGGTWSLSDTNKFDIIRDDPWNTTGAANGGEAAIRSKLDDLLYNPRALVEGGRGVPAAPVMNSGITIQAYSGAGGVVIGSGRLSLGIGLSL